MSRSQQILAANKFDKSLGSDINSNNIGYARKNAERHNANNVSFYTSDATEELRKLVTKGRYPDVIVLDPPREGASREVVKQMMVLGPRTIVYISCDPATFSRDYVRLSEKYDLVSVEPFDMFPQTAHIEIVAVMNRR